jgi:hypothetical protein
MYKFSSFFIQHFEQSRAALVLRVFPKLKFQIEVLILCFYPLLNDQNDVFLSSS